MPTLRVDALKRLIATRGLFVWLVLIFLTLPSRALASTTVAVAGFQDKSDNSDSWYWNGVFCVLLENYLGQTHSIHVVPRATMTDALGLTFSSDDQTVHDEQIRKLGQLTEAGRVISGNYRLSGKTWELNFRVMNTSSGKSKAFTSRGDDALSALSDCADQILKELGLILTPEEMKQLSIRPTTSKDALVLWEKSYDVLNLGDASELSDAVTNLEKATALDPKFGLAVRSLARSLAAENRTDEALYWAKRALELEPESAAAHSTRGIVDLAMGYTNLAIDEFLKASTLAPDDPESNFHLGTCYARQGNWGKSIQAFEQSKKSDPISAVLRGRLGYAYVEFGDREKAYRELKAAEGLDTGASLEVMDSLAESYAALGDLPAATEWYKRLIKAGKESGLDSARLKYCEDALQEMEARTIPHPVDAVPPRDFSEREIQDIVNTNLTVAEQKFVTNPFSGNSAMYQWAENLVGGTHDQLEIAKRLFEAVMPRHGFPEKFSRKTAMEVFEGWSNPKVQFGCQDYTLLYVTLARHLGLKAYYVLVNKDYDSNTISHACAGIFISGKAFLVDPTLLWFGVPHQQYEFEDDLRVISYFMIESSDDAQMRASLKLVRDWPRLQFAIATYLAAQDKIRDAQNILKDGLQLDSKSWMALGSRGLVEVRSRDNANGILHLQQSLDLNSDDPHARYALGSAYFEQGRLQEAREQFRICSESTYDSKEATEARQMIVNINEQMDKPNSKSGLEKVDAH